MSDFVEKYGLAFLCLILAVSAAWLLGFAIQPGIGLASDSYYYLSGADTMHSGMGFGRIAGDGAFKPTTHFPPLYSIALLATRVLSGDRTGAVPMLHQVVLVGMLLAGCWLVYRITQTKFAAIAFIVLMGFSPALLAVNSWMLSEGMFLLMLSLVLVCVYQFQRSGRWGWLFFGGLLTGFAYLTRYVGVTMAAAVALGIFLTQPTHRWRKTLLYLVSSAILPVLWLVRNLVVAGATTNRSLGWHPITLEKLHAAFGVVSNWILPSQIPNVVRIGVILLAGVLLIIVYLWFWRRSEHHETVELTLFTFPFVYFGFLLVSISIFDAATPLDERVLSPLYLIGGMLALILVAWVLNRPNLPQWGQAAILLVLTLFVSMTALRGVRQATALRVDGQGFARSSWRHSELISWLQSLPSDTVLYSNELDGIYLLTGQAAYQIPIKWDPVKAEVREDFQEQMTAMYSRLVSQGGYLVLFESLAGQQAFFPSEEELTQGLVVVLEAPIGRVYIGR